MALDTVIKTGTIGSGADETRVNQHYHHITVAASTIVVPAQAGKQIQITRMVLDTDTAGIFTLLSNTDIIMPLIMVANGGYKEQAPDVRNPLFSTSAGAAFRISVSVLPVNAHLYIHYRYR